MWELDTIWCYQNATNSWVPPLHDRWKVSHRRSKNPWRTHRVCEMPMVWKRSWCCGNTESIKWIASLQKIVTLTDYCERMNEKYLSIDCELCPLANTDSCDDCLVTFICDRDPKEAIIVSLDEWKSMKSMTKVGLLPELRNPVISIRSSGW